MREELRTARKVRQHAYQWVKKVVDAGPKRAAWLKELQSARDQAMAEPEVDVMESAEGIGVNDVPATQA